MKRIGDLARRLAIGKYLEPRPVTADTPDGVRELTPEEMRELLTHEIDKLLRQGVDHNEEKVKGR